MRNQATGRVLIVSEVGRILVVVDPTAAEQPAVAKAAAIAPRIACEIELFVCIHGTGIPGSRLFGAAEREASVRQLLAHQLGYLHDQARSLRGVKVLAKAAWDTPLHEGIVREVLRREPVLVMKDTHFHSALSRTLFTNTDWHLIRECPAPLWLTREEPLADRPVILACVDPVHEHDKPAALDERILGEAGRFAESLGGELHAVHCYDTRPAITAAGAFAAPAAAAAVEGITREIRDTHTQQFTALTAAHGIPTDRAHLVTGSAAEVLPEVARRLNAGLVVMGAVARSRLQQAVVGSTAERVLDRLPCDVLVVKPECFESPVTFRAQARDFAEMH